jgi:hypothetical protein
MLRRLRMGLETGTSKMLNEYRTRRHVNASECAQVMTSTMWDSIARMKSFHHSTEGLPAARDGSRRRKKSKNVKVQISRFRLIRKAIPPHGGKKVCFQNMAAKGCPGGANKSAKYGSFHFVPKKSDIPENVLMALESNFGPVRPDLK